MKKLFQIGAIVCTVCCANINAAQNYEQIQGGQQIQTEDSNSEVNLGYNRDFRGAGLGLGAANRGYYGFSNRGANYNYQAGYQGDYSGDYQGDFQGGYASGDSAANYGQDGCCEQAQCPPDQACGDCYCLYCHYEPCYYNCWRCVEEPQYYKKKCCRYVPKYYQVQRCRYVPQYYCETYCREEPEYYCVDECRTCKRWVCDRKCKYVPKYYYKHECCNPCAGGACSR